MPNTPKNTDVPENAPKTNLMRRPLQTADTVRKVQEMVENGLRSWAEYVVTLEARVRALENENAELRAALESNGEESRARAELALLESEVAEMLRNGKPPEFYGERTDKKEMSIGFLHRVYGRFLLKGKELIYLNDLRKLDPKFVDVITKYCSRAGLSVGDFVLKKSSRTDRVLEKLGSDMAIEAYKAISTLRMRKQR